MWHWLPVRHPGTGDAVAKEANSRIDFNLQEMAADRELMRMIKYIAHHSHVE